MTKEKKKKDVAAADSAAETAPEAKRRPVTTIRVEDCSASIWSRQHQYQGKQRVFYSVTLERSYKDRDGAWRYMRSFDPDSLGKIVSLCQQASEAVTELQKQDAAKQQEAAQ